MADFYSNLQKTASRLLKSKGQLLTFTRTVEVSFNPVTGVKTTGDFTFTAYGAVFDYKVNEIDGELIQRGDIRLIVEKTNNSPLIGDIVKIDKVAQRVMNVTETSPAGTVVKYDVQMRR